MEVTLTLTLSVEDAVKVTSFIQNMGAGSTAPKVSAVAQKPLTVTSPMPQNAPAPPKQNLQQMFPPMQTASIPTQQTVRVPVTPIPTQAAQAVSAPLPAAIPAQTVPQTYSIQALALAARPLMEMGRQAEIQQLLSEFGVTSLANLPEDKRAGFAARLRALGGQI